ncbi:MAG: hypothetical protein P1U56_02545 [Saprospiraceae bacterium]|nr:hypothetical protein [Saprospiraceae bacterium]
MKKSISFIVLFFIAITLSHSQTDVVRANFECDVVLDIYNGLYDWSSGTEYSGGQLLESGEKYDVGARTVANKNDTDGDGLIDNSLSETSVVASALGRNEVDLMKLVVRQKSGTVSMVKLKKISGDIRMWTSPTKGGLVNFDSNNEIVIDGSELDKTLYIEAINESSSLQDIELHLLDENSKVIDKVRATGVWSMVEDVYITKLYSPEAGSGELSNLNYSKLVNHVNVTLRSADGQLYGFGEHRSEGGTENKTIGGRMLFEFKVLPDGAGDIVNFDLTRQKEGLRKAIVEGVTDITDLPSFQFPSDSNQDNEKPNDDTSSIFDEDFIPSDNYIYVEDPPSKPLYFEDFSFIMERVNFKDFVRVAIQGRPPIVDPDQNTFGSRASAFKEWSVSFNFKKGENKLEVDNDIAGVTGVRPAFGIAPEGNGEFNISANATATSSVWSLTYLETQNQWILLDNAGILNGTILDWNSVDSWVGSADGLSIVITQGSIDFKDLDSVEFDVYKSNNQKLSKIQEGHINLNSF